MANQLQLFMTAEDELAFLRVLAPHGLEVYPRRIPEDWVPFVAAPDQHARLPEEDVYLAASRLGNVLVDKVKRGPDKGSWRVDEVRSPVLYWERCTLNDAGELLSGQLWAELDVTPQTGRRSAAPDQLRALYTELESWLRKTFRRGDPKPWLVGPHAARAHKDGLVLRDRAHRGGTVGVWR